MSAKKRTTRVAGAKKRSRSGKAGAIAAPTVQVSEAYSVRRLGSAMIPDIRKAQYLSLAMENLGSRSRNGVPSGVLKLGIPMLFQVACRNVIDGETGVSICKSLADELANHGITDKAMERWLKTLRESYMKLVHNAIHESAKNLPADEGLADPEATTERLMALLATRTLEMLESRSFAEADTDERHLMIRSYRECVKTLETLAKNRKSKADTEKIIATISKAAEVCKRGGVEIPAGRAGEMLEQILRGEMPRELATK